MLYASGRESLAVETTIFISHIIVAYVYKAANSARECMVDGHIGAAAITVMRHVQGHLVVSEVRVVAEFIRR